MKFLITNSVPLNGGDEALLRALIIALTRRWPDSEIQVLCKDLDRCRKQLPDLHLGSDLEFSKTKQDRRDTVDSYQTADMIISAPGGFLHDHYPIEDRLRGFEVALELSKPVILLAQSIGPFWKPKSIKRVREVLNRVSAICLRDQISREHLLKCGVDSSRIRITADAAFLWRRIAGELFKPATDSKPRVVGLSFRVWPLNDRVVVQRTIAKATLLCQHLLSDGEKQLLFLSTCQGITGYVDDSQIAMRIRDKLPRDLQALCEIDSQRYGPADLIRALGRCDAFIGMRLHACMLAMLAGVPAMGLGYEDKTEQIFRQMGLERYQIQFKADSDSWINVADRLLVNLTGIRDSLANALDERCAAAEENLAAVEEQLFSAEEVSSVTSEQRWSKSVERYGQPHLRLRQVAALVNELSPKRMLDVGCATGHLRLLCPAVEYVGCDFIAPHLPIGFPFYQCNFNRDPLPAEVNEFDVVVCSGILEYIEDLPAFLIRVRSRLRPGGHLVLTYFNMNHIWRIGKMIRGQSFHAHPDWRGFYSPGNLQKLVEKSGFQIVRSLPMNHALREAGSVEETVSAPLNFPKFYWWSTLFAHQFLFVAESSRSEVRGAP